MEKIFFVTYGGGHVNVVIPIIKQLEQEKKYECIVLGLTTASKNLEDNNIKHLTIKDFADERIMNIGTPLAKRFHSPESGISFEDTAAYYGFGMNDLIEKHGEKEACELFEKEGRNAFLPIESMKRIIAQVNADMVICTSSPRSEIAALIAAEKSNIPTIRIEQFLGDGEEAIMLEKTKFCVMSQSIKDTLMQNGVDEKNIVITGQPAFDFLNLKNKNANAMNIKQRLGLDLNKKILMWATQKTKDEERILNILLDIQKKHPEHQLIIKLHPNENTGMFQRALERSNADAMIIKTDLHDLIIASDLVITEYSTVGLEAILLDKPLMTINLTGGPDIAPYAETKAALGVYDEKHIETSIKECLCNEELLASLGKGRANYNNDGKATERICAIIRKMLDQ